MTALEKRPSNGQEMANVLKNKLSNLFKEYEISFAYLGGSWSKAQNGWWSDIDVFISLPNIFTLDEKAKIKLLTEISVKRAELTNFDEIEPSIFELIPLHVRFNAIHDGILLFERSPGEKANFVEKLLPRYYDHMIEGDLEIIEGDLDLQLISERLRHPKIIQIA